MLFLTFLRLTQIITFSIQIYKNIYILNGMSDEIETRYKACHRPQCADFYPFSNQLPPVNPLLLPIPFLIHRLPVLVQILFQQPVDRFFISHLGNKQPE